MPGGFFRTRSVPSTPTTPLPCPALLPPTNTIPNTPAQKPGCSHTSPHHDRRAERPCGLGYTPINLHLLIPNPFKTVNTQHKTVRKPKPPQSPATHAPPVILTPRVPCPALPCPALPCPALHCTALPNKTERTEPPNKTGRTEPPTNLATITQPLRIKPNPQQIDSRTTPHIESPT